MQFFFDIKKRKGRNLRRQGKQNDPTSSSRKLARPVRVVAGRRTPAIRHVAEKLEKRIANKNRTVRHEFRFRGIMQGQRFDVRMKHRFFSGYPTRAKSSCALEELQAPHHMAGAEKDSREMTAGEKPLPQFSTRRKPHEP